MKRRPSPGVVAAVSMAVRRQRRSNCIRRSVDSANANRASTESKDTPPIGPRQRLVPDDLPVGQPHDGMEHRPHARLRDEPRDLLAPLRLHARALDQAASASPPPPPAGGPLAAHDGIVVDARVAGGEVEGAQHARGGADSMRPRSAASRRSRRGGAGRSPPATKMRKRSERTVCRETTSAGRQLARPRAGRPARPRTRARRRRRRPSRAWSPVRPSVRGRRRSRPPCPSTPGCGARPRPPRAARAGR